MPTPNRNNSAYRQDPTRTKTLRAKFQREVRKRFLELKKAIVQGVWHNDAFGLQPKKGLQSNVLQCNAVTPPRPGQFQFTRDGDKVSDFLAWLDEAMLNSILEIKRGAPIGVAGSVSWADIYLQTAYQSGLAQAANRAKQAGIELPNRFIDSAFLRPVHADRAGLIFVRTYEDLKGITSQMASGISRALAQGIAEGKNPKQIAKDIVKRVDGIGLARAKTLARTEVIAAHAEAALNTYRELNIEGVSAEVEFATAGDNAVCERCKSLEGKVYTLEKAAGVIPVHPNCRCAWLPVIS